MKVDEPIKAILYLAQHASLKHQSDHTHFSKLCLLKHVVLFKKQNFRVFESSDICSENKKAIFYLERHTSL